ncbi:site-specific integrase [Rudaea cellulosilytica]|uniref:site-specific integrase n=1 Tax=Rudaea cellulosilytica TaxID=540746 RepID=UPI000378133E|nr:site-specific integrase [Rudaea cellulosilytica]
MNFDRRELTTIVECASLDGHKFDPHSDIWVLSRDKTVKLGWMRGLLDTILEISARKILQMYATTYSAAHTANMADRFKHFALFSADISSPVSRIMSATIISYRATLDSASEHYLGALSGFLKKWHELRLEGIDEDVISLLSSWRLKGNQKGLAVQIACPNDGPLSDLEYEALQDHLLSKFESGAIDLDVFTLVTLFMATGRRPAQIGDLRVKDFIVATASDGLQEYVLNVPRRKQRGVAWRSEFKPVSISSEIGLAVHLLLEENRRRVDQAHPFIRDEVFRELPIFPDWGALNDGMTEMNTIAFAGTEIFHRPTNELRSLTMKAIRALEITSERTGEFLTVYPTRLRRTLATRAAREGYGSLVIAELLDHSDDQNARVYTQNVPENVEAIDRAVAMQLAPLAQAFAGVLVENERDAVRGSDLASRVRTRRGECAGTCGHFGFCGALAPIACYTCRFFQPWLDGPHEEVLAQLIADRDRMREITNDPTIASINDRTIFAVAEVIRRCELRRDEIKVAANV